MIALKFRGHQAAGLPVTVGYGEDQHAVVMFDDKDKRLGSVELEPGTNRAEFGNGRFTCGYISVVPVPDDVGLAVALVHLAGGSSPLTDLERFFGKPMPGAQRWQYAVVNVGMFRSLDRMSDVLGAAGSQGWELVSVYDKASNWLAGMEKGFMLLKRSVPEGVEPESWCVYARR